MQSEAVTSATTYPMPELAAACRVLLRAVGLETRWTDCGPDDQAAAWLAADERPAELTADAWTMLRVCCALWGRGSGPSISELLFLPPRHLWLAGSYLQAVSLESGDRWCSVHRID
jgi:hypothetical protein